MAKIYLLYKISDISRVLDPPIFYAYTDKKEMLKEFEDTREMKHFTVRKEYLDKDDYSIFKKRYAKYRLVHMGFITKIIKNGIYTADTVSIVGPLCEELFIMSKTDDITKELVKKTTEYAKYLNPDIIRLLNYFHYFDFSVMKDYNMDDPFYSGFFPYETDERIFYDDFHREVFTPKMKYDQLSLFLYFYGYTMKV